MDRRSFLRVLGLSGVVGAAGALGGLPACTKERSSPESGEASVTTPGLAAAALRPISRPDGHGPWVLVIGGGVAGMSAAHELRERGLPVTVLEKRSIPGGKARSLDVPGTGMAGRRDLPGEHGFRFFPGFYQHLPDTMKRIPYRPGRSVFDNLVAAPLTTMARVGEPDLTLPLVKLDLTLENSTQLFNGLFTQLFGLSSQEADFFTGQMARFLASCDERRLAEFEPLDWWRFIGADRFSDNYRRLLAVGVTRNTVAARAEEASARTIGLVIARFVHQLATGGDKIDRLLNGPTNDVWINPWLEYLRSVGVDYHLDATVTELVVDQGQIRGVKVERGRRVEVVTADEYVLALPIEVAQRLVTPAIVAAAPELGGLANLKTAWMNGIQYFLTEPAPLVAGHLNYLDSPWALTSVSQQQFWPEFSLASDFGDGTIQDVLSVDISNWEAPGIVFGKPAQECSADEIAEEVWAQIRAHLDDPDGMLPDRIRRHWFLDPAITFPEPGRAANDEPLLINTANSWFSRPEASTAIPNLFLASDYVRTSIDLATMEGANEAARRVVNAILGKHRIGEPPCELFELAEPSFLADLRQLDAERFANGQPNLLDELGFSSGVRSTS
ncbi:MAG: FAD-dependent oxidoreductase [Acidimicrobiales bacterium]|nr:FAD-dependent oxidoreductase [Acidimicrobiales bacterium]